MFHSDNAKIKEYLGLFKFVPKLTMGVNGSLMAIVIHFVSNKLGFLCFGKNNVLLSLFQKG